MLTPDDLNRWFYSLPKEAKECIFSSVYESVIDIENPSIPDSDLPDGGQNLKEVVD